MVMVQWSTNNSIRNDGTSKNLTWVELHCCLKLSQYKTT